MSPFLKKALLTLVVLGSFLAIVMLPLLRPLQPAPAPVHAQVPATVPTPAALSGEPNTTGAFAPQAEGITPSHPFPTSTPRLPGDPSHHPAAVGKPKVTANPLVPSALPAEPQAPAPTADSAAETDLHKISRMLRDYRTLMGDNPVGSNAEIMKALMGDNPRQAKLGPPEGQTLNGNGELVDRWGTPYFFHQLSGDTMEIRSAGPDRKMWTNDDIIRR